MSTKSSRGHFFEDFELGQLLRHPCPRTIHGGDLSTYIAITGDRRPLHSSTEYAKALGFQREVVHDLLAFHVIFGKTVGDISLNAIANLGYAELRFLGPVYPGDTLHAESEVIGLRETSSGKSGVVYVRTRGFTQRGREVLSYVRWVLVNKRNADVATGHNTVPELRSEVPASELIVPPQLKLGLFRTQEWARGGQHYFDDYEVGEFIDHVDGMTVEESDHMQLTRLVQNTAKVHFNAHAMESTGFGKRLVYGGYVISVAHALSYNGLENTLGMAAWNSGSHASPTFAGDTIYASSEVLDTHQLTDELGALRLRLVAYKNASPQTESILLKDGSGAYDPRVVLDLDYWSLIPKAI